MELNSLCQLLPGPSSTQTITAIGFKLGGPTLAWLTLLVWTLPSVILMTLIGLWVARADHHLIPVSSIRFLPAMAVGFIAVGAWRISKMMVKNYIHFMLLILAAALAVIISYPLVFPLILIGGGVLTNFTSRKKGEPRQRIEKIRWQNVWLFLGVFLLAALLGFLTQHKLFLLFENTYRFGSLVFGGGNVLIPMMYNQFVTFKHYIDHVQFVTGVGFLQAIPGPVFSFSAYTGGMVFHESSVWMQLAGSATGAAAIFLPGIFLIFLFYPLWHQLQTYKPVLRALEGINAASAGLAMAAAWMLMVPMQKDIYNFSVMLITALLVYTEKIPSPFIVAGTITAGILLS